ncbi:MAG: FecR domain-containing protein [Opitutaceae bacterium]|nr:FecR domain-containing protein [Opitutaceae bacterium]
MSTFPFSHPSNDDAHRIGREAAGWLVKRDRGFTSAEQDAFFQWLAADPRHGEWFARHRQTWKDFNLLAEWNPEHSDEPNPDLLARPTRRAPIIRWAWFGTLAAACVALLVWWGHTPPQQAGTTHLTVAAKTYERHVLDDGSLVDLNTGARIEVSYTAGERRVRLEQGEASFTVAKNPDRPFIVRAAGIDVRAVGTEFNVRLSDGKVHVLVTEGRVRVDDATTGASVLAVANPGESPSLGKGEQVTVPVGPPAPVPVQTASRNDIDRQLGWRPQLLEFNSTPLGEVVAAFNQSNRIQMAVVDSALLKMPIVASFNSDNVEGFVRLLEMTAGVKATRQGDVITLHSGR